MSQDVLPPSPVTQVVLLGTGTPNPSPERSGPSVAVVVHDTPYLVDFGPGVVRRATALSPRYGGSIKGLAAKNLKHAFLTHLHSDHTAGYPDLILTPWVMGRDAPGDLIVDALARIFFQVGSNDTDALRWEPALGIGNFQITACGHRQIVLADLIPFGQVRIVILFAIPFRELGNRAIQSDGRFQGKIKREPVHHR